jgi:hypothetical protein
MRLAKFILNLFEYGDVKVEDKIIPFPEQDIQEAIRGLEYHYQKDILSIPYQAPDFHKEAAIWGATYLYRAVQMMVLRELGEEEVEKHLTPCPFEKTPEVIYSVDLTFRYLSDLLNVAKGLAPDDILVKKLKSSGLEFPLSSVGLKLDGEMNENEILSHHTLKYTYADRIILKKDKTRLENPKVKAIVKELLGDHSETFWKEIELDDGRSMVDG